jgi:hypothetical protein
MGHAAFWSKLAPLRGSQRPGLSLDPVDALEALNEKTAEGRP